MYNGWVCWWNSQKQMDFINAILISNLFLSFLSSVPPLPLCSRTPILPSHEGQILLLRTQQPAWGVDQVTLSSCYLLFNNHQLFLEHLYLLGTLIWTFYEQMTLLFSQISICIATKTRYPQWQVSNLPHPLFCSSYIRCTVYYISVDFMCFNIFNMADVMMYLAYRHVSYICSVASWYRC